MYRDLILDLPGVREIGRRNRTINGVSSIVSGRVQLKEMKSHDVTLRRRSRGLEELTGMLTSMV